MIGAGARVEIARELPHWPPHAAALGKLPCTPPRSHCSMPQGLCRYLGLLLGLAGLAQGVSLQHITCNVGALTRH